VGVIHHKDIAGPIGDFVSPTDSGVARRVQLDLPDFFDDRAAEEALELSIGAVISSRNVLLKSMYDFDLDTEDGVTRLLSLLPVLDPEIVKTIMQEIWPGYPVDSLTFDNSLARAEIRGYILDFLEGHGTKKEDIDHTDEKEPDGGAEAPQ
jgi:hypothetical protein